jgi:hypothetical protein
MSRKNYLKLTTPSWQKARMRALVRDDFRCQAHQLGLCETPCSETRLHKLHVHHLQMRIQGGNHDLDNLLTLCKAHHEMLHPWMKHRIAKKERHFDLKLKEL